MPYGAIGRMHIASALGALIIGAVVVFARKGTPAHRFLGISYVFAMLLVNVSALSIYDLTGYFGPFHAAAIFSLVSVLVGLSAPIFRKPNWLRRHFLWMGWSYFGLLVAAFAETMVRVPVFQVHSAKRAFEVAIGATIAFSFLGRIFMRYLSRAGLREDMTS